MERVRPQPATATRPRRKSVFVEVGLVDETTSRRHRSPAPIAITDATPKPRRRAELVRFQTNPNLFHHHEQETDEDTLCSECEWEPTTDSDESDLESRTTLRLHPDQRIVTYSNIHRLALLAFTLALLLLILHTSLISAVGVTGGVIPPHLVGTVEDRPFTKRDDTDTNVCKRWSHQSIIVNGTLYIYGGRSTTDSEQTTDTWGNDFLTLDLTKSWQIGAPSLTGLPRPSGPPEVANGYLWKSYTSLFLYGGEFSQFPTTSPVAYSTWEYNIISKQWIEHQDPKTSGGDNAAPEGEPVQCSAEGAGFVVSTLGRGWYFGGHLDDHTTEGWNSQVERVYLKSLLEFTLPGSSNDAISSLGDGKTAGQDGVYRNITEGGMQDTAGFTERADGLLLYVPGFGDEGLLLGLAGGVNETFTQMNIIDVYDIAKSTWYKQSTSGKTPKYRVNPCAVVAAAADGSSYNVYMFGGQTLQPAGNQTQYDDMWILSIPSFTWISVDTDTQAVPPARAGHSCHIWDGQMVVIGGYVGQELSCDSPGIYVFNTSSLSWSDQFTSLTGDKATQAYNGNSDDTGNPLAQQANQRGYDVKAGLEGSYGYSVPAAVQSVVGGNDTGGATLTAPAQTPTEGPLKTGKPITYTLTGPNGAIVTETTTLPAPTSRSGKNIGAIIAGTVAGFFALVAAYMAFCAWIYRKQVKIWKNHAAVVTQRAAVNEKSGNSAAGATVTSSRKNSSDRAGPRDLLLAMSTTNRSSAENSGGPTHMGLGDNGVRNSHDVSTAYTGVGGIANARGGTAGVDELGRRRSVLSSTDDLLEGQEPSFWGVNGVLLNPRRSLRVINRD